MLFYLLCETKRHSKQSVLVLQTYMKGIVNMFEREIMRIRGFLISRIIVSC